MRPGNRQSPQPLDRLRDRLGALPAAGLVYVVGAGVVIGVCWPLGLAAHALQSRIDEPAFAWMQSRQLGGWSSLWRQLTNIGSPEVTQTVTALAALGFTAAWASAGRRRWWLPLVMFPAAYALEKYTQIALQDLVHRGHPPTTLGTFPSGGCGRVLIIYGLVVLVACNTWWPGCRRATAVGAWAIAAAISVQAYARVYNLEHWLNDVIGGTVFGLLLLAVVGVCRRLLAEPADTDTDTHAGREAADLEPVPSLGRHRDNRAGVALRDVR